MAVTHQSVRQLLRSHCVLAYRLPFRLFIQRLAARSSSHLGRGGAVAAGGENMAKIVLLVLALMTNEPIEEPVIESKFDETIASAVK
ncbi:hypothetical protein [Ferriphaselus sp. R-1]|uniref:hypothetical protein n=1 Tax=Ferriphaselus sp. R-1 TaxID=1485544 RepID=UPI0012682716|nr:hypothetical protein [Ferriphaselus sp. R-1]